MNKAMAAPPVLEKPTRVRFGVLAFACTLSMITYLDRVCFGTIAPEIQKEFGLSETDKGLLFTAFAFAYAAFEVPTGWLGDVFGPRKTLIRIVLWWSLFTALTGTVFPITRLPWLAFWIMFAVRLLFGVGEAGAYPNIAKALHNWLPFSERGFGQGVIWMAGRFAGGATPFVVTSLLLVLPTWRATFWIFGLIGLTWCALFWLWFRDRPEQKDSVNQAELDLIRGGEKSHESAHANVPWGTLLTSGNLWLLCGMYFCAAYGWYFNITYLPGYLTKNFGISKDNAFWTFNFMAGAPLLFGSLACLVGGLLTDYFIRRTGNRKWGRRLFGIVGHSICALCYFLSMTARNPWFFVLAVAMAAFWNDLTMGAAWASCLDIGKKYSGIVAGCMNTIGNLGGAAAGYLTGRILDHYTAPAHTEGMLCATLSNLGSALSAPAAGGNIGAGLDYGAATQLRIAEAAPPGWTVNFFIFGAVYVIATLLWLNFDSTKPVVRESGEPLPADQPITS